MSSKPRRWDYLTIYGWSLLVIILVAFVLFTMDIFEDQERRNITYEGYAGTVDVLVGFEDNHSESRNLLVTSICEDNVVCYGYSGAKGCVVDESLANKYCDNNER